MVTKTTLVQTFASSGKMSCACVGSLGPFRVLGLRSGPFRSVPESRDARLGVCVCVSVTQHLTFHVFILATNNTNLVGGRRSKILKILRCEARAFPVCMGYGYTISRPFFHSAENAHAYESDYAASGGEPGRSLLVRLLAIGSKYASNKGMPAV